MRISFAFILASAILLVSTLAKPDPGAKSEDEDLVDLLDRLLEKLESKSLAEGVPDDDDDDDDESDRNDNDEEAVPDEDDDDDDEVDRNNNDEGSEEYEEHETLAQLLQSLHISSHRADEKPILSEPHMPPGEKSEHDSLAQLLQRLDINSLRSAGKPEQGEPHMPPGDKSDHETLAQLLERLDIGSHRSEGKPQHTESHMPPGEKSDHESDGKREHMMNSEPHMPPGEKTDHGSDAKREHMMNDDPHMPPGEKSDHESDAKREHMKNDDQHMPPGQKSACGGTYTALHGTIRSPNYPRYYPNNMRCEYRIRANPGQRIEMEFTSFTLESGFFACEYDSLEVYDGSSTFDSPLGTYCGSRRPPPITTSGNTATLLFASDESETEQGFSINYRVLGGPSLTTPYYGGGGYHPATPSTPTTCGGTLTGTSGNIRSPGYPNYYANDLNCVWTIQVPSGRLIRFDIQDFEMESQQACDFDYLEIKDGRRIVGKYCGNVDGRIPTSTSNAVTLTMVTNRNRQNKGFSISYRAVSVPSSSVSSCGTVALTSFTKEAHTKEGEKIINGVDARRYGLPYQVELQLHRELWCGGSIIHPEWILTAAHCIIANTGPGDYRIIAGNINRNRQSQVRDVLEMIPHESYNTRLYEHDIALLRIAPLNLNNDARTICIPAAGSDTAIGTMLTASGWGNLDTGNNPRYPTTLKKAGLYLRDPTYCRQLYSAKYRFTAEKQLCAGRPRMDTCQGDSGGPFARVDGRRYFVDGITSYGYGCAQSNTPGVYTRVSYYGRWVQQNTRGAVRPFSEY